MAMVTNRSTEFSHGDRICQDQEYEKETESTPLVVGVPDMQSLSLKGRDMSQSRKQEQVEILWPIWTRYDTSRQNILDLVVFIWSQVNNDPDIDPAIQLFVPIELRAVNQKHENTVVLIDRSLPNSI